MFDFRRNNEREPAKSLIDNKVEQLKWYTNTMIINLINNTKELKTNSA